jgi:hypothetical protein
MQIHKREFLIGSAAATLLSCGGMAAPAAGITPEEFGAKGDGRTNDTDAFAAMSAHVNARGGGTIVLRPVTYIVGKHAKSDPSGEKWAYAPAPILQFLNCSGEITIRGNGAKLRCASGLRFGTFHPATGSPTNNKRPFYGRDERASPYIAMILVRDCAGPIEISDLELDGNLQGLQIGGRWGNAGYQIPAYGIQLKRNSGPEKLSRIYSHHHALDGLLVQGSNDRAALSTFTDVRCEYNGRQGCSITGGRNYVFERCQFRHTGKAGLKSSPGAGVDIEPGRGWTVRNLRFLNCEFADNAGVGLLAPVGDSEGATFESCRFIGTTSWSAWPNRPGMRFNHCSFVGALIHAYGDADPRRAAQFHDCDFRDDPALSPTGEVYGGTDQGLSMAKVPRGTNILFDACRFRLTHNATLPWSKDAIYSDCEMTQRSEKRSHPGGIYLGVNHLSGNIALGDSTIRGTVMLNGRSITQAEIKNG